MTEVINSGSFQGDLFGWALDMDPTTLVISAVRNGIQGKTVNGAVYIFELINGIWTEVQKLTSPLIQNFNDYGYDLDLDGNKLAISEYLADVNGNENQGVVHLYTRIDSNWELLDTIYESFQDLIFKNSFELE